jgi:hypothetical protein
MFCTVAVLGFFAEIEDELLEDAADLAGGVFVDCMAPTTV